VISLYPNIYDMRHGIGKRKVAEAFEKDYEEEKKIK
jgi:hypothetical protein